MDDEYTNPAIQQLIEAATTQVDLAMTCALFGLPVSQSTISRWLHTDGGVAVNQIPTLIAVAASMGIVLNSADLRPDLARLFAND